MQHQHSAGRGDLILKARKFWCQANGLVTIERKEVSRKTKSKVFVKEQFVKSEVIQEYELEEEDISA